MKARRANALAPVLLASIATVATAQSPSQPTVQPGPQEPDWIAILEGVYGLRMFADLANPVETTPEATPGLFRKAGPGPVTFRPEMALGLPAVIRGGYYVPAEGAEAVELWNYQYRNTGRDIETGENLPPPLNEGSTLEFDPGSSSFGLYIANDQFRDAVYSEPKMVAALNERLAKQPYKAMIYPYRDPETGRTVPHSYLIGWEYSTNDDFQDVVCRIDNVELVRDGRE